MPNMLDYLQWRGDLTIANDPLNENDELILSQLAYVAFGDGVPGIDNLRETIPLSEAVGWLLDYDADAEKIHQTGFMWKDNQKLLRALRQSARFRAMKLSGYVEMASEKDEKQFSAMTVDIGDGTTLISYRGTDDSLIGWKEDLNMVYACPVPAQHEAVRYMERVAAARKGMLRLGGHSKGGNLAVYAASHCGDALDGRLFSVVSHDGPGQSEQTVQSDGYARIHDRLRVYLPHFSFVGMLLEHAETYTVVQSDAKTVLQHDAFSWQMQGTKMLYAEKPSEASLSTNRILRDWIATLDEEHQRLFIEAVFELASEAYGEKLPRDVETNWPASTQALIPAFLKLDPKMRASFNKGLRDLFSTAIKNIRFPWQKEDDGVAVGGATSGE